MAWENSVDCSVVALGASEKDPFAFSVDELLLAMDNNSVDKAVVHCTASFEQSTCATQLNDILMSTDRLRTLVRLPKSVPNAVSVMERYFENDQVVGFIVESLSDITDPFIELEIGSLSGFAIWEVAEKLGAVLVVDINVSEAHVVPFFLEYFPTVNVVAPRTFVFRTSTSFPGSAKIAPNIDVQMPVASKFTYQCWNEYPNLFVMLSGYHSISKEPWPYKDIGRWFEPQNLVDTFGADRLLWGSDFPWTSGTPGYRRTIEFLRSRLRYVSASEQGKVASGTALELFF